MCANILFTNHTGYGVYKSGACKDGKYRTMDGTAVENAELVGGGGADIGAAAKGGLLALAAAQNIPFRQEIQRNLSY